VPIDEIDRRYFRPYYIVRTAKLVRKPSPSSATQ
jgi:hypothetical protein